MTSDVEYLLLRDKGPYHELFVRRRINVTSSVSACRFYTAVIVTIAVSLLVLLLSLVYVFVLVPSWATHQLPWGGGGGGGGRVHVLTHTHCGSVEGVVEDEVFVFKGIPYAVPPLGPRRWRPAEPLSPAQGTCWRGGGTRPCKRFGEACPQPRDPLDFTVFTGSEDCLVLNVWTTSLHYSADLPVMVWIHGGGFVSGSGHTAPFCPTPEVTKATGAVYVSLNYRLGALGFLALGTHSEGGSSSSPSEPISGNYGLMDIVVALQWVQHNIQNFGGDPHKVTLFGQDSGGTAIHALLASPLATGLFQRAWLASPSAVLNRTSAEASRDNEGFMGRTGCQEASCLRAASVERLMRATPWTTFPYWGRQQAFSMPVKNVFPGALPVVDGYVLKDVPIHAWSDGRGNDVPTMFTTTAQEADLLPFDSDISSWTWRQYRAAVRDQLTPFSRRVADSALDLYPAIPTVTPEYQYTSMLSDVRATCPVYELARVTARGFKSPVFRAVITARPSSPVHVFNVSSSSHHAARYAFHGWDMAVFFGDFFSASGFQPTAKDLAFQRVLRQQIMAFARDGRPEAPVWDTARACVVLLSDHVFPMEHYNKVRCEFWMQNGFMSYAWIN